MHHHTTSGWALHPDRALPADSTVRGIAREIYQQIAGLPIISMHGHIDAGAIARDGRFADAAELFVIPDHYVLRMLVSQGVRYEELGVAGRDGRPIETDRRAIWRRFCEHWAAFRGTPCRYWLEHELVEVLGVSSRPSAETADVLFDEIQERLDRPEYRVRALLDRFDVELLSTTDPAQSNLEHHAVLRQDGWGDRVVPTMRPDPLFHPHTATWGAHIRELAEASGVAVGDAAGFLEALRVQRRAFIAAGGRATDHGHLTPDTTPLEQGAFEELFSAALSGPLPLEASLAFAAHMLFETARMSLEDGLVMQLHTGVVRDHSAAVHGAFGSDVGFDIPEPVEFTRALRPMLSAFGHDPRFRVILYTIDESTYSRELAPLAGAYPSVLLGAPWWFLDAPGGLARFRELTTETAGFRNTSGFVDDTRALLSIPARHDLSRRIDAGHLAKLVAEHRLELDEAVETAIELTSELPRAAFTRTA